MNAMIMRRFSLPGDVDRARQYVLQVRVKKKKEATAGTMWQLLNRTSNMKF